MSEMLSFQNYIESNFTQIDMTISRLQDLQLRSISVNSSVVTNLFQSCTPAGTILKIYSAANFASNSEGTVLLMVVMNKYPPG